MLLKKYEKKAEESEAKLHWKRMTWITCWMLCICRWTGHIAYSLVDETQTRNKQLKYCGTSSITGKVIS